MADTGESRLDRLLAGPLSALNMLTANVFAGYIGRFLQAYAAEGWGAAILSLDSTTAAVAASVAALFGFTKASESSKKKDDARRLAQKLEEIATDQQTAAELLRAIERGDIEVSAKLSHREQKELAEIIIEDMKAAGFLRKGDLDGHVQMLLDQGAGHEIYLNTLDLLLRDVRDRADLLPDMKKQLDRIEKKLGAAPPPTSKPSDPTAYIQRLRRQTRHIDIRGLEVGSGKATRLPIDELYISLATTGTAERRTEGKRAGQASKELGHFESGSVDLRDVLKHRCVVIVGDPGSGKSTFLRRLAFELCRRWLGERGEGDETWKLVDGCFPILVPLAGLIRHIEACRDRRIGPVGTDAPRWLTHFAGMECRENEVPLDEDHFVARLKTPDTIVLLDGLDEPPTDQQRVTTRKLIERAAGAYPECRFVVTTRPAAYKGEVILHGFEEARIDALSDDAIVGFLRAWCDILWRDSKRESETHLEQLLVPIRQRPDIRALARNPVMLTALAVVHWNEKCLPEQRAELYESIIKWLAKSRESRPERPTPERCVTLLQELALAMQGHAEGRQTQVSRHWSARAIAAHFREHDETSERIAKAEEFLEADEVDSGIIVGRGDYELRFWHLTFQEYLAARELAAREKEEQDAILLRTDKLHLQEWREVVLLLAGVLHQQGIKRVDSMVKSMLSKLGPQATLSDKARCAGLLSEVLRDLSPVGYKPEDMRYKAVLEDAMAIFDGRRAKSIPIEDAIAAAEAIGQAGDPRFANLDSPDLWVTIPAGSFWMGAQKGKPRGRNYDPQAWDDAGDTDESPVHTVSLSAYRISRYPVTVCQFERFVNDGGYSSERFWTAGGFGKWESPDDWHEQLVHPTRPVVGVSWYEAAAYAAGAGCRLPTEAEWERAARGPESLRYPWGNDDPKGKLLNFDASRIHHPTPVGVYPLGASAEGVLDMAGNVWEWCKDWYGPYQAGDREYPAGPPKGDTRVLRGGSWGYTAGVCRASFRLWNRPAVRNGSVGFRVSSGTL